MPSPTARRSSVFLLALLAALAPRAEAAQDRPARAVPALPRPPKVDGELKDFRGGLSLKKAQGDTASIVPMVAFSRDALLLAVTLTDDDVQPNDTLDVTLFFPGAGTTAQGHSFRFSADGQRTPDAETAAPVFAQKRVQTGVKRTPNGFTLELAIPARALPRFPARDALLLDLCLTYADRDGTGGQAKEVSTCKRGSPDEPLKLPNALRDGLKLKPPAEVVGLEAREKGWVGYAMLHYPHWVQGDAKLTHELLTALVAERPINPESARLAIPEQLRLPGGRSIWPVVSGKDPYAVEGKCDDEQELRLGLYLMQGKTAMRVLEWPAATCTLGRAISVGLDEEAALTIGYSNGATVNFAWSTDHFERTELGKR